MKIHPAIAIIILIIPTVSSHAAIIAVEDFEDNATLYTTSIPQFSDNEADYFGRIPDINPTGVSFNNLQGSGYFAAQDIDGEGAASQQSLLFSNINITGYSNLSFSAFWAEDDAGSTQNWDVADFVLVEYAIDGNTYEKLFAIEDQAATNTEPRIDTNFDGIGDGAIITDTFTEYAVSIGGTGDSLSIRITMDLDSGDEDIAFDNILLTGTLAAVPEPASYVFAFGCILFGWIAYQRRLFS